MASSGASKLRVRFDASAGDAGGQNLCEAFELYEAPLREDALVTTTAPRLRGLTKPRSEVHREGHWHRAVEVWIVDGDEVLAQRRSALKDTNPGKLDVSCAGHVAAGAEPLETALRELREELGVDVLESDLRYAFLAPCVSQGTANGVAYVDREFIDVFFLSLPLADTPFTVATSEVQDLTVLQCATVIDELSSSSGGAGFVPKPPHYVAALADAFTSLHQTPPV